MNRKLVLALTLTLLIGTLSVASYIHKAKASGTIYIRADGSIDPPTAPVYTADNITYTLTGNIIADARGIVIERNNIVVDGASFTVEGENASISSGVGMSEISNVTIKNMNIEAYYYGINFGACSNNKLNGNNITANTYCGIWFGSSLNNNVSGNDITANNYCGIYLDSSSNNSIKNNSITANTDSGIRFERSSNNSISRNNIANNSHGIYIDYSSNESVTGNNITANTAFGIYLSYSSNNNSVYHNNFVNNTQQVVDSGQTNFWDDGYPSGGNYWSDYLTEYPNAAQVDSSGVWNTPYVIDTNNTDHYPLMVQYVIPEFPSFLILLLFMITTLLTVAVYRKKHVGNQIENS